MRPPARPFAQNFGWVIHSDSDYSPRGLSEEAHAVLAIAAVNNDAELTKVEKQIKKKIILAITVGRKDLHVRIYDYHDVVHNPDHLPSRMTTRDTAAFLVFNDNGGVELVEGTVRYNAQSHRPLYYATRRLTPAAANQLDRFESQITGAPNRTLTNLGMPRSEPPLETVDNGPEPPSLEP